MAILPVQLFGQFSNPETNPTADDSRTQGDDNIRALASSMQLTFPNLSDQAVTVNGARLNGALNAGDSPTITGSWIFASTTTFASISLSGEIAFTQAGDAIIRANNADAIQLSVQGGSALRVEPTAVTVQGTRNLVVGGSASVTGSITGTNIGASGYVSIGGQIRVANINSGTSTALNGKRLEVYNTSGVFQGYIRLFD